MNFKKVAFPKRKRHEYPNRYQRNPIVAFRSNLSPRAIILIKHMKKKNQAGQFINRAIEEAVFKYYEPKRYLIQIIENNYRLIRHLLRKVGRGPKQRKCI